MSTVQECSSWESQNEWLYWGAASASARLRDARALSPERVGVNGEQVRVEQQVARLGAQAVAQVGREPERTREHTPERERYSLLLVRERVPAERQLVRVVEVACHAHTKTKRLHRTTNGKHMEDLANARTGMGRGDEIASIVGEEVKRVHYALPVVVHVAPHARHIAGPRNTLEVGLLTIIVSVRYLYFWLIVIINNKYKKKSVRGNA